MLPGGTGRIAPGAGEEARVDAAEPFKYLAGMATLTILMSTRHDPIASAVYRQKIGTVDEEERRRESGARDRSALPMKEYAGGGKS